MIEALFAKPFVALLLTSISCSILGIFILWRRLSFLGDSIAHSILLGFVLGITFNLEQNYILVIFSLAFALLLAAAIRSKYFSKDTIIAILSYFCIALAIILNDITRQNLDFSAIIFGDILSVTNFHLYALSVILFIVILFAILGFRKMLLININQDLAAIEGIKIEYWNLFFTILLTIIIALSVKIVGVMLMTALLVLPAAIARIFSASAIQMLGISVAVALGVCLFSIILSYNYNLSLGALTILIFCIIFIPSLLIKKS